MSKQTLHETAPDAVQQFKHNLSLASASRSETQRRDALSYLTSQLSANPPLNPVGTPTLLDKLLPLISDNSGPVRTQLLKLFRTLPETDVRNHAERAVMYVRAGMTHLSKDVNNDSLAVFDWLLDVAEDEAVACPGGWVKPIKSFCAMLGWTVAGSSNWSSAPNAGLRTKDAQSHARQIAVLAKFLHAGLKPELPAPRNPSAYWDQLARVPRSPAPFAYLNLFTPKRDEDGEMYSDRESRQRVFRARFFDVMSRQVERAKKEGGAPGRAAAALDKVLEEGMSDYAAADAMDSRDLLDLW